MSSVLFERERTIVRFMKHNPGQWDPLECLAIVVWPSEATKRLLDRQTIYRPRPRNGNCSACGIPYTDFNMDCGNCRERHRKRKYDALRRAA